MAKLTEAQRRLLVELEVNGPMGEWLSVDYKPALKLLALRFASVGAESFGHAIFRITEAGRKALEEKG